MALESVESMQMRFYEFFDVMEQFFLAIYIMEFLLKIYAEPIKYWKAGSNTFAFMVLLLCLVERFLTNEQKRAMDLIRAVQPLRTLRTIFFIRGLQVLSVALVKTIKSVLYILFLLFLLLFVFALIGFYFFGTGNTGNVDNWSSLRAAFFTLFNLVTLDSWTDFQAQIVHQGTRWNRIFTIGFILLGCFLFFNLFIGVIIINIRESDKEFNKAILAERETRLLQKKQTIVHRQQEHIKQLMEKQKTTQFESFGEKVQNFKKTLKHDDYIVMDDLCSSLSFIDIYLTNLDQQDDTLYKLQNLYFELSYILGNMLEGESGASALDKKRHS
eukprot:gi/632966743/ref/XP_007899585.1/ PREDICTED: cation channel sperm-associated protein 3 [Callorhinchus milii]